MGTAAAEGHVSSLIPSSWSRNQFCRSAILLVFRFPFTLKYSLLLWRRTMTVTQRDKPWPTLYILPFPPSIHMRVIVVDLMCMVGWGWICNNSDHQYCPQAAGITWVDVKAHRNSVWVGGRQLVPSLLIRFLALQLTNTSTMCCSVCLLSYLVVSSCEMVYCLHSQLLISIQQHQRCQTTAQHPRSNEGDQENGIIVISHKVSNNDWIQDIW